MIFSTSLTMKGVQLAKIVSLASLFMIIKYYD